VRWGWWGNKRSRVPFGETGPTPAVGQWHTVGAAIAGPSPALSALLQTKKDAHGRRQRQRATTNFIYMIYQQASTDKTRIDPSETCSSSSVRALPSRVNDANQPTRLLACHGCLSDSRRALSSPWSVLRLKRSVPPARSSAMVPDDILLPETALSLCRASLSAPFSLSSPLQDHAAHPGLGHR